MWLDAAQASWSPAPPVQFAATPPPIMGARTSTATIEAPRIMMVRPSIASPAVPVLLAPDSPEPTGPETPMVPIAYASTAVFGLVSGIAAAMLLIAVIDASYVNIHP